MKELEGVIGGVEPELELTDASEESTFDKLKGLTFHPIRDVFYI